jgi:penicillin-binding protein 1A
LPGWKKSIPRPANKAKALWKRYLFRWLLGLLSFLVLGAFLFFMLVKWGAFGPLPSQQDLAQLENNKASLIFSADGRLLRKVFSINRTELKLEDVPPKVIDALLATEDVRFYEHNGVDYRSLARVLVKSLLLQNRSAGGGSTLTQQLAKNLYGRPSFSFLTLPVNKVKEIILAWRLEELYSKAAILEMYLNTVSFSENTYGLKTGAMRFFNKSPQALKVEEGAVLVGLLKANTYYNPRLNPAKAKARRNVVLNQMGRYHFLSPAQVDSLKALPLQLDYINMTRSGHAAYFSYQVEKEAQSLLQNLVKPNGKPYQLKLDGLKIYTTLNDALQQAAEKAVARHLAKLQRLFNQQWSAQEPWHENPAVLERYLKNSPSYQRLNAQGGQKNNLSAKLNEKHKVAVYHPRGDTVLNLSVRDSVAYYLKLLRAGCVALNPKTGAVETWVGGANFQYLPYDHVLAKRQAASTFKPIVFAAALEQGLEPCQYISAERRNYPAYDNWSPRNYNGDYEGFYSMAGALKKSVNTVTVKTLLQTGVNTTRQVATEMGISSQLPPSPTIALGTASLSLLEVTQAYACLANGGYAIKPYKISRIENAQGEVIYQNKMAPPNRVLKKETALLLNEMLQKVVNQGTGVALRSRFGLKSDIAGKTGTAQNYTDGWFVGYNPGLVMGVWVGGINPVIHFKSGAYGSGSAMALPIFGHTWQNAGSLHFFKKRFEPLTDTLAQKLNCPDYREATILDKVKDFFKPKKGQKVKTKSEDKPGLLKRIFGKKEE